MDGTVLRRRVLAGSSLGVLASLAGCIATGRETETVTETFEADAVTELSLSADDGSVTAEGSSDDALEVRGHKAAPTEGALESLTLETGRDDGRLEVETDSGDGPLLFGSDPKLDLEATVPDTVDVIDGATTNGDIDVRGIDGDLRAATTNGPITVAGVGGDVRAETTNGEVDVTLAADGGDLTAETTNASITVHAPPSLDATVTAATENGEVTIEAFDGVAADDGDDVTVTLGDGSRSVRIETTNAPITVRGDADE